MSSATTVPDSDAPGGVKYWRSLEQLENTAEFQTIVDREFADGAAEAPDEVSRRGFLGVIAASVALAGLTSCRKPVTHILPFNARPEGFKPGIAQYYATTLTRGGYGLGVLARSNDGRPTKIEGNPLHPSSLGGSDAFLQGEILQLYDPARSRMPSGPVEPAAEEAAPHGEAAGHEEHASGAAAHTYDQFRKWWAGVARALVLKQGEGLRLLVPPTTSRSLQYWQTKVTENFPKARFHTWEPIHRDAENAGSQMALGRVVDTQIHFGNADVVVSFDCDFLALDGANLRHARHWAQRRKLRQPGDKIARLYVAESCFSTTGTMADHRFRMRNADTIAAVFALAGKLGLAGELGTELQTHKADAFVRGGKNWIDAVARDLQQCKGRCVVVAGPRQPAVVHAVVHAINAGLDAVGKTITYTATPAPLAQSQVESIAALKRDIDAGQVEVLVCLGTNPVYDAPADLQFKKLLADKKVKHTIHLGLYKDETGQLCDWHFNAAHDLESWGDAQAHDGTVSLRQPLIAPLHGGISMVEFLALLTDQPNLEALVAERDGAYGHQLVKDFWKASSGSPTFDSWWKQSLHDGVVPATQSAVESVQLNGSAIAAAVKAWTRPAGDYEVQLRPDSKMWDGRYGNNSWMQELPDPLTKLVWDNAALISSKTAADLGVKNGDNLTIAVDGGASLQVPTWILPGHADHVVTITLGYGRELGAECKVARGTGFNAYMLRTVANPWSMPARVSKGTGSYTLACTQEHGTMAGRAIVRENTLAGFQQDPEWAPKRSPLDQVARHEGKTEKDRAKSLWTERFDPRREDPEVMASPYQWGMVIDLNACTGCSACLIACVAENNISMVGKAQVARGREMFWIRADRYFSASDQAGMEAADDPQVSNQPVPCMQCENAPCESVCPVVATSHGPDGLNDMVYNRCIGTRYCSNNCPYKVRRFNYLDYLGHVPETKKMAYNPDVTVRSRGVMEKCTYCVQRINGARIKAKLQKTKVQDGDITPACAQTCPTEAITFGNLLDQDSRLVQLKASPLNYGLLSELNTKPRTTYLGRIRNPNPELA